MFRPDWFVVLVTVNEMENKHNFKHNVVVSFKLQQDAMRTKCIVFVVIK